VWAIAPLGMVRAGHDDSAGNGGDEYVVGGRVGGCGVKVRKVLARHRCRFYTGEAQRPAPLFSLGGHRLGPPPRRTMKE
jgi:hypothetical protein